VVLSVRSGRAAALQLLYGVGQGAEGRGRTQEAIQRRFGLNPGGSLPRNGPWRERRQSTESPGKPASAIDGGRLLVAELTREVLKLKAVRRKDCGLAASATTSATASFRSRPGSGGVPFDPRDDTVAFFGGSGLSRLSSLGEDAFGRLYAVGINGVVVRLVPEPATVSLWVLGLVMVVVAAGGARHMPAPCPIVADILQRSRGPRDRGRSAPRRHHRGPPRALVAARSGGGAVPAEQAPAMAQEDPHIEPA